MTRWTGCAGSWTLGVVHALIDGLGVAVCLGRLAPEEAVAILRSQLERLR